MSKINVILGAGFSRPADFPTGYELNQKFFHSMENKMLRMSSGEWVWDEHDSATSNNGRLNYDFLNISYLLSEFVEKYQKSCYKVFNYEEFFDWFKDNYGDKDLMKDLADKVNQRLKEELGIDEKSDHYIKDPGINEYRTIYESFNYLIGDLLGRDYNAVSQKAYYSPYIDYLKKWDTVNIFTLNHDLLTEYLLRENLLPFSDGFSKENSFIVGEDGEPLSYFCNSYTENIKLFKIHGSIDYFRFDELIEDGSLPRATGKFWFFKPESYYNKHNPRRIDPTTKEVVQKDTCNTVPQFLTGKNKKDFMTNQHFYSDLHKEFVNSFDDCEEILIIGYAYSDLHINSVIKTAIDKSDMTIKNINPSMDFPFRKDYKVDMMINMRDINELK